MEESHTQQVAQRTPKENEVTILALQLPERVYEQFPATQEGIAEALEFLRESATGGALYKIDHYRDKHGDILPRSTRLKLLDNE
jgi:hypothetical protein